MIVATDNIATFDGSTNDHRSVTDSVGNTWTKAREFTTAGTATPAAAGTGATVSIWYTKATVSLPTTGSITVNFSGSITAKAATCYAFNMGASTAIKVDGGSDLPNINGANAGSITLSGLASIEHLWLRGMAIESNSTTYTASTSFTASFATANANTGTVLTSMNARGEHMIFTGTSQTTAPTTTSGTAFVDIASSMIALSELTCAVAEPSYVAVNTQSTQAIVYWSSANPVLVLRKAATFTGETPVNGTMYAIGAQPWGGAGPTVVYNGTTTTAADTCSATGCTDTGLTNGTTYYYKVFARSGVSGTPCYSTATVNQPANGVSATPQLGPRPAWSFKMAGGAMMKPGIVGWDGAISTGSNATWIFSLNGTTGTPKWAPVATGQAVQSWLTWLPTGAGWSNATWTKRKLITIDGTKVASGGVTDFPVLISITDANLKAGAQSSGNDILFTSSDGITKLSHEIERYDNTSGQLIAWVKVPSLPSGSNTTIYMYYGNAAAGNQQNATDVWSNGYVGVWHLKEDPGPGGAGDIKDSTSNQNNGTAAALMTSADLVTGKIGGGLNFIKDPAGTGPNGTVVDMGDKTAFELPVYSWSMGIMGTNAVACGGATTNQQPLFNADTQFQFNWGHSYTTACQSAGHADTGGFKQAQIPTGTDPLLAGTWYNIAATYDGATIRVYLNGVLKGSIGAGTPVLTAGLNFAVGNRPPAAHRWDGQMDEVRVGSAVRADGWILTEYNNQNSPGPGAGGFISTVGGEQAGSWTPSTPCTSCSYVIGGNQGGKVYSVDELTGGPAKWTVDFSPTGLNKADNIQAAVGAQLRAYSNTVANAYGSAFQSTYTSDIIIAASRNTTAAGCLTPNNVATKSNKLFAINAVDGSVLWTFNDAPCGTAVDYITGMPYVDYGRNRLYVTSGDAATGQRSLWIIKTVDGETVLKGQALPCAACSTLGTIDTSPVLGADGRTLYFGNINGRLYAFDVNTLTVRWYRDMGAAIKGFVWEDGTGRLYFSTANAVWRVKDNFNDTGLVDSTDNVRSIVDWQRAVTGASMPLLLPNAVYVGSSSDFLLHEIALDNSTQKTLALDSTAVGDVSTDDGTSVYVSTGAGTLYKIPIPLP